jgi:hypothetical protein
LSHGCKNNVKNFTENQCFTKEGIKILSFFFGKSPHCGLPSPSQKKRMLSGSRGMARFISKLFHGPIPMKLKTKK